MMLKKSLISILLIMCFLVGNLSTASAVEEDVDLQKNESADSHAEKPKPDDTESSITNDSTDTNDGIFSEFEKIEKIDEADKNEQNVRSTTVSGPGPYDITPGVAPDDFAVNIEEGETCQLTATNPYGILFT